MPLATIVVASLAVDPSLEPLVLMFPPCGMLIPLPSSNPAISKSNALAPSGKLLSLMLIGLEGARTPLSDSSSNKVIEDGTTFSFAGLTVLFTSSIAGFTMDRSSVPLAAVALTSTSPLFAMNSTPLMLTLLTLDGMLNTGVPFPAVAMVTLSPTIAMSFVMLMSAIFANSILLKFNTPPSGVSSMSF